MHEGQVKHGPELSVREGVIGRGVGVIGRGAPLSVLLDATQRQIASFWNILGHLERGLYEHVVDIHLPRGRHGGGEGARRVRREDKWVARALAQLEDRLGDVRLV